MGITIACIYVIAHRAGNRVSLCVCVCVSVCLYCTIACRPVTKRMRQCMCLFVGGRMTVLFCNGEQFSLVGIQH